MLYRFRWFLIAFSMVLALAPFSGVMIAAILACVLGCEISDAAQEPCNVYGVELGRFLSNLTLTTGLAELVFPLLAVILTVWTVIECFAFLWRRWHP